VIFNEGADRCLPYYHTVAAVREGMIWRNPTNIGVYIDVNTKDDFVRFRYLHMNPKFMDADGLLSGRHVIFCDLGVPEATQAARELFASTMATLVDMDLESHDRLIAYVLGLSHALNIAFFTALAESGEAAPRLATLSSTTFDAQLGVAAKVAGENPDLYFEIQTLNDYGTESLAALLYAVERLRSVVRANDLEGFRQLMTRGRAYLDMRVRR
jgi:chorismate mutase/prephenate dehydrogenase